MDLSSWVKKNKAAAVIAGGGGFLFLIVHKGHQANSSGVADTGGLPDAQSATLVPVATAAPDESTDGTGTGGVSVGGDLNSPFYPPGYPGTGGAGSEGPGMFVTGTDNTVDSPTTSEGDISPVAPAAAANDGAANNPPGHPGYTSPKNKKKHAKHKAGATKSRTARSKKQSKAAPRKKAPKRRPATTHSKPSTHTVKLPGRPVAHSAPRAAPAPIHHAAPPPAHHPAPKRHR